MQFGPCQTQLTDSLNDNYIPQAQYYISPSYMDFVHGKRGRGGGGIIFILRRYDPVLFPTSELPQYSRRFSPHQRLHEESSIQSADEVRIIMNSFTLKDSCLSSFCL